MNKAFKIFIGITIILSFNCCLLAVSVQKTQAQPLALPWLPYGASQYEILGSANAEFQKVKAGIAMSEEIDRLIDSDKIKGSKWIDPETGMSLVEKLKQNQQNLLIKLSQQKTFTEDLATITARALAGDDWKMLDNVDVKNPVQGIEMGLAVRASRVVGDAISKELTRSVQAGVGGAWGWASDRVKDAYRLIFHGSNKPFTRKELIFGWKVLVGGTMTDIFNLLRDGLRETSRSQIDMTQRAPELLSAFPADVLSNNQVNNQTNSQTNQVKPIAQLAQDNFWTTFIGGYVEQFDYLAKLLDERKEYYDEDSIEVFYASQIRRRLIEFKDLLLRSKSLKELDALLGSNKTLVTALRFNVEKLFDRLADCVEPDENGSKYTSSTSSSYSRSDRYGGLDMSDGMYPYSQQSNI
jgi:hypothetical protein